MDLEKSASTSDILVWINANRSDDNIVGMSRYGIETHKAYGVPNAQLRPLARQIGRNHARALELWNTGWREARLLAIFTADKKLLTLEQAHRWADDFDSWEIVDGATSLFVDAGFSDPLIAEFAEDKRTFVRRAAFALVAWSAVHQKKRPDAELINYLKLVEAHAADSRNFVKKAVNWALRSVGKRSLTCHQPALDMARKLAESQDSTTRWIGKDAVRELSDEKILERLNKKRAQA